MANRINSVSNHMRIEPHSARTGRSCHVSIPLVRLKPRRVLFLSRMLDHGLNHRSTVLPKLPYRSTDWLRTSIVSSSSISYWAHFIVKTHRELLLLIMLRSASNLAMQMLMERQRLEHLQTSHTLHIGAVVDHVLTHLEQIVLTLLDLHPFLNRRRRARGVHPLCVSCCVLFEPWSEFPNKVVLILDLIQKIVLLLVKIVSRFCGCSFCFHEFCSFAI